MSLFQDEILKTIHLMIQDKITEIPYNTTVIGTIVSRSLEPNQYTILFQGVQYEAFSLGNDRFNAGDSVYILVLNNTLSNKKMILGRTDLVPGVFGDPGFYGSFYDDAASQPATVVANTAYPIYIRKSFEKFGVSLGNTALNTKIIFENYGTYNIQFSIQFQNTDANEQDVKVWIRKNGSDISNSSGIISIPQKHGSLNGHAIASWNYVLTLNKNDFIEFYWSGSATTLSIISYPATTSPVAPLSPGIIVTATQVANSIVGPQGPKGDPGDGVPPGGNTGQVLAKASNTDYDVTWVNNGGGGGSMIYPGAGIPISTGTAWNTSLPTTNLSAIAGLSGSSGFLKTNGTGTWSVDTNSYLTSSTGVTSVTGTSPVSSTGGTTPAISLASGYGDTQNPYASKTANYFLAAPNGTAGVPSFRAIVAADIPILNQNTTGTAATLTTARTIGDVSFNGSANIVPERILFKDTRATNYNPFTYIGLSLHLKTNTTDGLNDGGTFHGVLDLAHWNDSSGGVQHQLGLTNNGNMWMRYSTGASTWSNWTRFVDTSDNLSAFSSTTSSQLAGIISDETGSGALVFATSPSLTTPNIGVASGTSLTLTGDLAVNGGDITTSATTFNLVDTTATTINFAGAATTLNLGYDGTAASTTNINTGAVANATTKTINIGTGGVSGSNTNVFIGSATTGAKTVIELDGVGTANIEIDGTGLSGSSVAEEPAIYPSLDNYGSIGKATNSWYRGFFSIMTADTYIGLPVANGTTTAGIVSTGTQTFGGSKTFGGTTSFSFMRSGDVWNNAVTTTRTVLIAGSGGNFEFGTSASTIRLKEQVSNFTKDCYKVLQLNPVTFKYKKEVEQQGEKAGLNLGYIAEQAQELELDFLYQVDEQGIADYFAYEKLPIYLLEIIKNQQKSIEEMLARIEALENK